MSHTLFIDQEEGSSNCLAVERFIRNPMRSFCSYSSGNRQMLRFSLELLDCYTAGTGRNNCERNLTTMPTPSSMGCELSENV